MKNLEKVIQSPILEGKINFIYGVELQSIENIHMLAYFQRGTDLKPIQQWIEQHLIKQENDCQYYGHYCAYQRNPLKVLHSSFLS